MELSNDREIVTLSFTNIANAGAVNINAKGSYFEVNHIDMKTILQNFVGKYKWCNLELSFIIQGAYNTFTTSGLTGHNKTIYLEIEGLNWVQPPQPYMKNTRGKIFGTYTFPNAISQNSASAVENELILKNYSLQQEAFSIENIEFVDLKFSLKTIAQGILSNPNNSFPSYTIFFNIYPILESAIDTTSIPEFNKQTFIEV